MKRITLLPVIILVLLLDAPCVSAETSNQALRTTISISASVSVLSNTVAAAAVRDAMDLLGEAFPANSVRLNDPKASVTIVLPSLPAETADARQQGGRERRPWLASADQEFAWRSRPDGDRIFLTLDARTGQAVSFGLYGLLQEKLGFRFLHPRQTIIPRHTRWPLAPDFLWKAAPRFPKRGFHIHSLHPVELTEQLHDPDRPGAFDDVTAYIDWLARNQQNMFQFYLLREIDRDRWIPHAQAITSYARSRGIKAGVQVSLSMVQQKAFQLVRLLRPWPYTWQADTTLAWLMQAQWDFVTVEFSLGEHLPDLGSMMPGLRGHILDEIGLRYGARAMTATHVIRAQGRGATTAADTRSGVLVHTVMCYSLGEPFAPVYGNVNQRHMLELAEREVKRREVWYWPESSYWVAFDSSVPLLLLPYLEARFEDMDTMERLGAEGHLTFSSGWEWGYWLVDWSIARWSWRYEENGARILHGPLTGLRNLFPGARARALWGRAHALQQEYLKNRRLLPYLTAADPSAELFWPFDPSFAPRLPFRYRWLLENATAQEVADLGAGDLASLAEYGRLMNDVTVRLSRERGEIAAELSDALLLSALRAKHRGLTLRALIAARKDGPGPKASAALLAEAAEVRGRAQEIVRRQEQRYRYPPALIALLRSSATAYQFGYLYPAHDLHFWRREEGQVRQKRFDAIFMNLWDFRKVAGIGSLVW